MGEWSDLLGSSASFHSIMKSLCGEYYDRLNKQIPENDIRYQDLLKYQEVKNLTDLDDTTTLSPVDGLVLICIYAWIRVVKKFRSPDDLAPLFLVFARYLMTAYQFHIVCNPNTSEEIKNYKEAKDWIFSKDFENALEEFCISLSASDLENGRKRLTEYKPSDSLSRPFQHGIELLHGEVCSLLGIKPIYQIQEGPIQQRKPVETTVEKVQIIPSWNPPQEQITASNMVRSSPILWSYWQSDGFGRSCNFLWEKAYQLPAMRQVVMQMISEALDKTTLNREQRLLAVDLLKDLPCWGLSQKPPRLSVSCHEAAVYGSQRHYRSELSLLLDQLLSCGLLGSDGLNIKIAQPVINDFSLTLGYLKNYGFPTLLPQGSELTFSRWLYWTLDHLIAENRLDDAGRFLYRIQGSLPGYASRSWREIAIVLGLIPDFALREPLIWIILTAAMAALEGQGNLWEGDFMRAIINLNLRIPTTPIPDIPEEILKNKCKFQDGIRQYLALKESKEKLHYRTNYCELFELILEKPRKSSGENKWLNVHFLSDLRNIDTEEYNSLITSSTSPSRKTLMKQARASDAIMRLAVAELLATRKDPILLEILDFEQVSDFLPSEITTRETILEMGFQFPHEYGEWI
jgi:hypothetical protein